MCYPLLIMAAVAAAGTVVAKKQTDKAYSANSAQIKKQSEIEQNSIDRQMDQQHASDIQATNEAAKKSLHDMALFDTVAGEYGGGVSDNRAKNIQGIQNGERLATIQSNGATAQTELGFHASDAHEQSLARLGSLTRGSGAGLALSLAGAAANAYGMSSTKAKAKAED